MSIVINPFVSEADQPIYRRSVEEVRGKARRKTLAKLADLADRLPSIEARLRSALIAAGSDASQLGVVCDFLELADEALALCDGGE